MPVAFQARVFTDLSDIERIEVLRGPQSTLYGKSASAGLINVVTRGPSPTFSATVNASATLDEEYTAGASVAGPITDQFAFRISGNYDDFKGNVHNVFNDKTAGGRESAVVHGKLVWTPDLGGDRHARLELHRRLHHGRAAVHRAGAQRLPARQPRPAAVGLRVGDHRRPQQPRLRQQSRRAHRLQRQQPVAEGGVGPGSGDAGLGDRQRQLQGPRRARCGRDRGGDAGQLPGRLLQVGAVHAGSPAGLVKRQAAPLYRGPVLRGRGLRAEFLPRPLLLAGPLVRDHGLQAGGRLRSDRLGIHPRHHGHRWPASPA